MLDTYAARVSPPLNNLIIRTPKCRTDALWVEGLMTPEAKKLLKGFHKTFSPRRAFLGNENDDYALSSSHVNLEPRVSRRLTKHKCSPSNC